MAKKRPRGKTIDTDGVIHLGNESWATAVRARRYLAEGKKVSFVGLGHSMEPFIPDKTRCLIVPVTPDMELSKKEAVFCKVRGSYALHRIRAFKHGGRLILIGNNHGHIDGWTTRDMVFGRYAGPVHGVTLPTT